MFMRQVGTTRTSYSPAGEIPAQALPLLKLSQAAADFMAAIEARQLDPDTIAEYRTALWYLIEFLGCDPPVKELAGDTLPRFVDWLRATPIAARVAKTRPKVFNAANVADFFHRQHRSKKGGGHRTEQTIGKYARHIAPFLEFLGLPTQLPARGPGCRPNLVLPPALVPIKAAISDDWRDMLTTRVMPRTAKRKRPPTQLQRRRVVLIEALVYLSGMRMEEALKAQRGDVEGRWLLLREAKGHRPRIICLSPQALGIIKALHSDFRQQTLFEIDSKDIVAARYVCGWGATVGTWHTLVHDCQSPQRYDPTVKRHHAMRRKLATWLRRRDADSERAQLGHGGGQDVIFRHYLDYLQPLPKLLKKYRLPDLGIDGFQWPAPIKPPLKRPDRLYAEIRRLVNQRENR